jgi:O-methyltransferase involved in polyketide biosynthesis
MANETVSLGSVQETMLMPLWGRAFEMKKEHPLLVDAKASEIVSAMDYDFSAIEKNIDPLTRAAWIARSLYFDGEIRAFQESHPGCSVINIGCGLDTTYDRVNDGKSAWYELDLPDVISMRKRYIPEEPNRKFIAESVFGEGWYGAIENKKNVIILFAGVLYYFEDERVRSLFKSFKERFASVDVIFDYCSRKGLEITNKRVIDAGGMNKDAYLRWSVEDIRELETWGLDIRVLDSQTMFEDYKKNYPPEKQTGMNIADSMKIMSLAHIRL